MSFSRITQLITIGSITFSSVFFTNHSHAEPFSNLQALSQQEFDTLAEDIAAITAFRANAPAISQGVTGFEIQANFGVSALKNASLYDTANPDNKSTSKNISQVALQASKGLPFGVDVGVTLRQVAGLMVYGVDARKGFFYDSLVLPTVSLRGSYVLTDNSNLKVKNMAVDVSVSKNFFIITPYAGVGQGWSNIKGKDYTAELSKPKLFAGFEVGLFPLLKLGYEFDDTAGISTHSLKLALKW